MRTLAIVIVSAFSLQAHAQTFAMRLDDASSFRFECPIGSCAVSQEIRAAEGRLYVSIHQSGPSTRCVGALRVVTLDGSMAFDGAIDYTGTFSMGDLVFQTMFEGTPRRFVAGLIPSPQFPSVDVSLRTQMYPGVPGVIRLVTTSACSIDFDDGSGRGIPDDAVGIDDLLYFLAAFERGSVEADLDDGSARGLADSAVTIDDLLYFLGRFEAGC